MATVGNGCVINIASIYGSIGIDQRAYKVVPSSTVFYCAAKAGVIQMTKELAVQYADKGVRINCISPGHFPKPPSDPTKGNPQYVDGLASMVPMRRVGCADEVAGAVVFLASNASSYVTGHNLVVDGGRTVW
jgi:gluconate 5-dehydrogenase